jgi:prepilin-type N-terminal cleavage/methylation domain-containing protein
MLSRRRATAGQRGFSLIEVAVSVALLAVVFPALVAFLITVLQANTAADSLSSIELAKADARSFVRSGFVYADGSKYRKCGSTLLADSQAAMTAAFAGSPVSVEITRIESQDALVQPSDVVDTGNHLWVADYGRSQLLKVDKATNTIISRIQLEARPIALAHSTTLNTLAVVAQTGIRVYSLGSTPEVVRQDAAVWPMKDAAYLNGDLYVSTTAGRVVAYPASGAISDIVVGAGTDTLGPVAVIGGRYVFVGSVTQSRLVRIDTQSSNSLTTTQLSGLPQDMVVLTDLWITVAPASPENLGYVDKVVNPTGTSPTVTQIGPVGTGSAGIGAVSDGAGAGLWIANFGNDDVVRMNSGTNALAPRVAVGDGPQFVAGNVADTGGPLAVVSASPPKLYRVNTSTSSVSATVDLSARPCAAQTATSDDDTGIQVWTVRITAGGQSEDVTFTKVERS